MKARSMANLGHSVSTDNHSIKDKVKLRRFAVRDLSDIRVLDLFAGNNVLWSYFDCTRYYGVEKEPHKGKNLTADNLRVISSLDLSGFNVIDCDSYGIPFNQIYALFRNRTLRPGTVVVYTCISSKMCALNKQCLREFNLSKMYAKSKTLLSGKAVELFYAFLQKHSVSRVWKYVVKTSFTKEYGYFFV